MFLWCFKEEQTYPNFCWQTNSLYTSTHTQTDYPWCFVGGWWSCITVSRPRGLCCLCLLVELWFPKGSSCIVFNIWCLLCRLSLSYSSLCLYFSLITSFLFLLLLPNFLVVFLKLSLAVCLYPFLQFLSGFKNFNEPGFLCTFCSGELSPKMLHLGFDVTVTLIIDWLMNGTASQPLFSSLWEPS